MGKWTINVEEPNGSTKTVTLNMSKEFEEQAKEEEKLWCKCSNTKESVEDAEYVENYLGVKHGYICPKCKKFVQIG